MSRISEGPFTGAVYRGLVRQGADAFACNPFRELASLSLHAVLTYPFKTHDVLKRSAYRFTRIRGVWPPARRNQNQGALAPRSPKPEYQNQGASAPRSPLRQIKRGKFCLPTYAIAANTAASSGNFRRDPDSVHHVPLTGRQKCLFNKRLT